MDWARGRESLHRARSSETPAQDAQPVELIPQLTPVNSRVPPEQLVADSAPLRDEHGANRYMEAAIIVIGIAAGIALLRFAEGFFVPLLVGLLTSYVLGPLVSGLQRVHIPRAIGAAIVLVAVVTLAAGVAYALSDDAARIADQLPSTAKKVREMLHERIANKPNPIASVHKAATELDRAAKEASSGTTLVAAVRNVPLDTNGVARLEGYLVAGTSGALLRISELLLALLLAYFLLAAGDSFRRKVIRIAGPSLARRRVTVEILNEIHDQVQRYMLVLLTTNVLIGLATWGLFAAAGLESAGLWGFVAALLHMIPYAGSALLAVAVGVAALIQFESWTSALLLAAGALGVATLIGIGLNTWMNSWVSHMNPVMMFGSLLLFGWLWGAWGLLLALPLLAVLKAIAERIDGMNAIAELIRDT
jgi:predicted PurR-regulated permease PerM